MILRPYQVECRDSIKVNLRQYRSTLAVLATGLGKTVIFAAVANSWQDSRVMVMAHREELIRQSAEKVEEAGASVEVEMGGECVNERSLHGKSKVVVTSVQTMSRDRRQQRFNPDEFGLLIIDEAHHAVSATYRKVIDYFRRNSSLCVLGVTATPNRADELAMGMIFPSCAYSYGIEPAGDDGWLVPVRQKVVQVDELDFSQVRTTAGDFNDGDLERVLLVEKVLHAVAAPAVELAGDRPALVFCVSVAHAERMAEILGRYKPGSAHWLSGETPIDERRDWVRRYKEGRVQFLCNCGLFLEGFDAPSTAVIVMARPTKSLPLYTQVIGRGTRTLPGVLDGLEEATPTDRREAIRVSAKPYMDVLDFAGNAGRHKIISAGDVLGGKFAAPVREYARKTVEEEGQAAPVRESLERAADELDFLREEEERARRAEIKAKAEYRAREVSVFGHGATTAANGTVTKRPGDPPTDKQVRYLVRLGVNRATAEGYSKRQASVVIDNLVEKSKAR